MIRFIGIIAATVVSSAVMAGEMTTTEISSPVEDSTHSYQFTALDKDGNSMISREEAAGSELEQQFSSIDANGDGQISSAEMTLQSGEATAAGMPAESREAEAPDMQQSGMEKAMEDSGSVEPMMPGVTGEHHPEPVTE